MSDTTPKPAPPKPRLKKAAEKQHHVDDFLLASKTVVLRNYNEHMVPKGNPPITLDDIFIVWFSKTLGNWKALVATIYADGLYYEVTRNSFEKETYVDVYRRMAHSSVSDAELKTNK